VILQNQRPTLGRENSSSQASKWSFRRNRTNAKYLLWTWWGHLLAFTGTTWRL